MKFEKLLIVIPTRNRVELAMTAIESVLEQEGCDFQLLVSDNSTEAEQAKALKAFCEKSKDTRLAYIQPDEPLRMAEHWNWALEKGLSEYEVTHVSYLTDRMLFVHDAFKEIAEILNNPNPGVISYNTSGLVANVVGHKFSHTLHELVWSGRLFEVSSKSLIEQFANGMVLYHPMPRMMNSVVSVPVLTAIRNQFGKCFSSISPDFNFAFKVLDTLESTFYYDKSLLLQYGGDRSNGVNLMKGNFNKDATDFLKMLDIRAVHFQSPVEDFYVMPNPIMYEYFDVKVASDSGKFPAIDQGKYLASLIEGIYSFENVEIRETLKSRVFDHLGKARVHAFRIQSLLRRGLISIRRRLQNRADKRSVYFLMTDFETLAEAVDHIHVSPRPPYSGPDVLKERFGALAGTKTIWPGRGE